MTKVRLLAGLAGTVAGVSVGLGLGGPAPSASAATAPPPSHQVVFSADSKPQPPAPHPAKARHATARHATARHAKARHAKARRAHASRPVLMNCMNNPVVRPRVFTLSCGDSADTLARLHWHSWRNRAVARGIQQVNSCTPDCAHGRYARYPVTVILSGAAGVAGHPRDHRYTMITLRYLGKHPAGVGAQVSGSLWP